MNVAMSWMGLLGNDKKALYGLGEIEFLRKFYLNDGTVRGYLHRAIPNLISKDL
jgi:hypothetical protein